MLVVHNLVSPGVILILLYGLFISITVPLGDAAAVPSMSHIMDALDSSSSSNCIIIIIIIILK